LKEADLAGLIQTLPAEPGIQGRDEYFNSVVLVLLVPVDGEFHVVFEKRAPTIRQGGEISLPGGEFDEADGSLENTALRETDEEIGIPRNQIEIVGRLDTVFAPMGAMVNVFVGITHFDPAAIRPNPNEVERVFLLPVSHFERNNPEIFKVSTEVHPSYFDESSNEEIILLPARELGLPEKYWKPWGGFKHKIFVYRTSEGTIWGITARIMTDLAKHLKSISPGTLKG